MILGKKITFENNFQKFKAAHMVKMAVFEGFKMSEIDFT